MPNPKKPDRERRKPRVIRIEDDLYDKVQAIAAIRGESVSDVARRSLQHYARNYGHLITDGGER